MNKTYSRFYLLSAGAFRRCCCDNSCRCCLLNMFLYFGNRARVALIRVFYKDNCICVLVEIFGNANETINGPRFLWLRRYEFRRHAREKKNSKRKFKILDHWTRSRKIIKYLLFLAFEGQTFFFLNVSQFKNIQDKIEEKLNEIRNHS